MVVLQVSTWCQCCEIKKKIKTLSVFYPVLCSHVCFIYCVFSLQTVQFWPAGWPSPSTCWTSTSSPLSSPALTRPLCVKMPKRGRYVDIFLPPLPHYVDTWWAPGAERSKHRGVKTCWSFSESTAVDWGVAFPANGFKVVAEKPPRGDKLNMKWESCRLNFSQRDAVILRRCLPFWAAHRCSKYTYLTLTLIPDRRFISSILLKVTWIKPFFFFFSREFAERPFSMVFESKSRKLIVS